MFTPKDQQRWGRHQQVSPHYYRTISCEEAGCDGHPTTCPKSPQNHHGNHWTTVEMMHDIHPKTCAVWMNPTDPCSCGIE